MIFTKFQRRETDYAFKRAAEMGRILEADAFGNIGNLYIGFFQQMTRLLDPYVIHILDQGKPR